MFDPFNRRLKIRTDYLAAIAVTLMPIMYFGPAIARGAVLCPNDGIIQNVPLRVAAAEMIRSGHLPLWNPFIFSGMPLLAAAQGGILFPLNWFYLFFSAATATNLMVVTSYMVAALGAFLYARRIGTTVKGAMITSLVWQCSGALVGQISHINIVHTAALLPWTLWSLEAFVLDRKYKYGVLLSALVAIQVFAGHQQTLAYSLILLGAYALVMAAFFEQRRTLYLCSLAFIFIGVLLSSIQILPTAELLRNSERVSASYEFFTSFSMPKKFVLTLVSPFLMGGGDGRIFRAPYIGPPYYEEMVGYVGGLALMLSIVALILKPDRRTKLWAVVAVVGFFLAFGGYAPLQVYRLIYYVPVLNLFRVPARHLMEVNFALAVLAGRGLSVLEQVRDKERIIKRVAIGAGVVVVLTILAVTVWRPSDFHLQREAPITLLRAPELFVPIILSVVSLIALYAFATNKRGSTIGVFTILLLDLALWGQSTGWSTLSPNKNDEYWRAPESVQRLTSITTSSEPYRILTLPHAFDPEFAPVPPSVSHSTDQNLWTQPDVYMLHRLQNAAGYDGFGLSRYSELAGRMKVWGELTDPNATLRGASREIDLLNTRYVLAMRNQSLNQATAASVNSPGPTVQFGNSKFGTEDLGLPNLQKNKRIRFNLPDLQCDRLALVTNLSWSEEVPDGTVVAEVRLISSSGEVYKYPISAGGDTADWAYDRPDIRARIKHKRASIAASYSVSDANGTYQAHTYVSSFVLPKSVRVVSGDVSVVPSAFSPDLTVSVFRISLANSSTGTTYPVRRDWVEIDDSKNGATEVTMEGRWKRLGDTQWVTIYENMRALPRVWLASEVRVLDGNEMLDVIRSGKFSDGSRWNPEVTALIESPIAESLQSSKGNAQITRYEPNRIELNASTDGPSILVLSENHYPGWRAYVDGRAVETLRVDYNLRGVVLPAGSHQVSMIYKPKSMLIGLSLSLAAVVLLASWPVVRKRTTLLARFGKRLS